MQFVVNASPFFSALLVGSRALDIIFSDKFKFFTPEFLLSEVIEHEPELIKESGLTKSQWAQLLDLISAEITFVPRERFIDRWDEAEKSTPDPDDVAYLALAFKFKLPVWSDDEKHFKKQSVVKVYTTEEMLELLESL